MTIQHTTITRAAIFGLCCCALHCQRPDNEGTVVTPSPSFSVKVADLTPEGWEIFDEIQIFTPENLYEHIDGRAEFYLAYDVVEMMFVSLEKTADDGCFINLSIYDMGTPTNAFGVFSGERTKGAPPLDLGRDAYRSDANYYIWKGQYYIQIVASDDTDELRRIGMDMGRKVADSFEDSGEPVWGLDALPKIDRVPNTVQYFVVDAMGLDFMRNTYTAEYAKSGTLVTAFLSQLDSPGSAENTVGKYLEHANRYGAGVKSLILDSVELTLCDMGGNYDVVFRKGCLVGGVAMVEDQDLAVRAAIDLWKELSSETDN
ncbi:MAG: DUF6599 family protein [bacterium]